MSIKIVTYTKAPETLPEHRAAKLTELATSFSAAEANGCLLSSTGFEIDATERANRDISGLVTVLSQDGAQQNTYFCDHNNIMHPVTLADLKTMQLEIIAYGQALYARKWEIRSAIEAAETVEDVQAIDVYSGWPGQKEKEPEVPEATA